MRNFINIVEALSDLAVEKTSEKIGPMIVKLLTRAEMNSMNDDAFKEITKLPGETMDRQFIRWVATQIDPSPKSIYTVWLIKMWLGNGFRYLEDMNAARPLLALYDKAKPKLDVAKREINIFKSFEEFEDFTETLRDVDLRSNKERDRETEAEMIRSGAAEIYLDTPEVKIVIPHTEAASCWFGRNTKWCTAATNSRNAFESYADRGLLYIILFKATNIRWQFQPNTCSFMDEKDTPLSDEQIKSAAHFFSDDVWETAIKAMPCAIRYAPNPSPRAIDNAKRIYGRVFQYKNGQVLIDRSLTDNFTDGFIQGLLYDAGSLGEDPIDNNPADFDSNGSTDYFYKENIEITSFLNVVSQCLEFQLENSDALEEAYETGYSEDQAGCDFYHVRCGSGISFADRNLPDGGVALNAAAEMYGSVDSYPSYGIIYVTI